MHIAMTSAKGEAYAIAFMYNLHLTSWKVEPLHPQLRLSSKYQPQLMRQNHFFVMVYRTMHHLLKQPQTSHFLQMCQNQ
ncbi:hypothetical protein NP493_226g00019 [Ridgeia piscesae]|uniref:Uncharacterized protein n=1 Tax=Ridgeia piscesae TaxID=27915 RepID=A0AAD9UDR9_RIDPI|nr:hypothetical protein NP493_226g00019 [Ridgeia piscesae]